MFIFTVSCRWILQGLGVHLSWWGKFVTPRRLFSGIRSVMDKYHLKRLRDPMNRLRDSMNHGPVLVNGVNKYFDPEIPITMKKPHK